MRTNTITPLLKKTCAAERETVQNYLANSVWLDGLRAQEVVEVLAAERDAIATYEECSTTDPVTADRAGQVLADEGKHRSLCEGFRRRADNDKAA